MSVAIEPRFGKHKIYHIRLQEARKLLAAAVQICDVINKNEHFHLQSTTFGQGPRGRIE